MKKSMRFAAYEVREAIPLGDAFPKEPPKESFGTFGSAEDTKSRRNEGEKLWLPLSPAVEIAICLKSFRAMATWWLIKVFFSKLRMLASSA